jgi:hypothetical protein
VIPGSSQAEGRRRTREEPGQASVACERTQAPPLSGPTGFRGRRVGRGAGRGQASLVQPEQRLKAQLWPRGHSKWDSDGTDAPLLSLQGHPIGVP